jgi:hypothetical protein
MKHRLVGLSGYAGSGKDTAAEILLASGYQRLGFADPLKELATRIGWDGHKDDVGRKLLQDLGLGARDVLGDDVWVNALLAKVSGPTVITDVRFANEVHAIHSHGGVVVRIVRPGCTPALGHISETGLDGLALPELVNDADVFDLHLRLLDLLDHLPSA